MKTSTPPKYQVVHDAILSRLMAGHYSIGTRLPTEELLSKTFDVSRVTIRKALEMLVRAGYLTARQGSGYVVATLSPPSSTCMASFTDQVLNEGRIPGAKLLGVDNPTTEISAPVRELFDEPLVLVQRLRTVDGLPRMFTQTWIPVRLAPNMAASDFPETGQEQSILRILRRNFGVEWTTACETLDSVIANPEIATRLDVAPNTPILSQACTAFDPSGQPVFFDQVYRQGPINFDLSGGAAQQTSA
ncbi:GntR family transcriptional regulator [Monaibacterium marinum]|uniref:GntR family transcriptional regulator n=1 Tax=Pontivivens marinum TaxID=1690039 RepID=A0A2C9CLR3_9RHOB|nr:GntR family transcriptional regulator [Monaibacterium marinum]SOH92192.1 GntR family transcriptional regulator [Monaibacterium marinum]